MIDLFDHRLKRMTYEEVFAECIEQGKLLEKHMVETGFFPQDYKIRAVQVFSEALRRPELQEQRPIFEAAIKVIAFV